MKKFSPFKFILGVLFMTGFTSAYSQLTVTPNPTIAQIVSSIAGTGAIISNATLTCPNGASGVFSNGSSTNLGINSGVLLTTGSSAAAAGGAGTFASVDNLGGGNALLTGMAGATTYEECRLEFDIMPTCGTLQMSYVFGSEEYPEFVNSGYNDAFGFFVTGPNPGGGNYTNLNIANVPGTGTFVGIDNVNSSTNSAYYIDNSGSTTIAYDGITTVLTASISVTPCQSYHMILVIADGGDGVYDSGVFLTYQGLTCPAPTVTPSAAVTICPGQSTTISASGMTNYTWTPGGMTGSSISVSPSATTTYTVTGTSGLCNIDSGTVVVTVAAPASTASNTGPYCVGSTINLSASGGGTYAWSGPSGFTSTSSNPTIASASAGNSGVYTVTVTSGSCTSTATTSVSVTASLTPSTNSNNPVCEGNSINLTCGNGVSWNWTGPNGFTSSLQNPTITPATTAASGTYSLDIVDAGGCSGSGTISVTVNALPTVTASTPSAICSGSSGTLNAGGGSTYSWSAGTSPGTGGSVTASPASTTTYTVTGTDVNGCSNLATVTLVVNNLPTIVVNSPTICQGITDTLVATGGVSYSWSAGTTPISQDSVTVNPGSSTSYTVTGTDANGCINTAVSTVNVTSFTPALNSNSPICEGDSLSLTCSNGVIWNWTGPNGFNSASQNPAINPITSADAGTFSVTATDANGCSGSSTVSVSVNTLPPVTASSGGAICSGNTGTLNAGGASTYSWSAGTSPATGSSVSATPGATTAFTVTGTDGNGCSDTAIVTLVVNSLPTITVNSPTVCPGMMDTLVSSGAVSYTWSAGTTPVNVNQDSVTVAPASTTSYTVTGTDANGCTNTAVSTVTVNSLGLPVNAGANDTICLGGNTTLTASGAVNYTWNPGASSGTTYTVTPGATTTFTVVGTDLSGCSGTDSVVVYVPTTMSGTPASTNITCNTACDGTAGVTVSPSTGPFANYTYSWSNGATTANINSLCPGTYSVTVTDGGGCTFTTSVALTQPGALSATSSPTNILCNGGLGAATITPSGGTPGYTYSWAPSGSGSNATNLAAGNYTVTVSDANSCTTTVQFSITQPNALTLSLTPTSINCTNTTGSIASTVGGGTSIYVYSWSPSTATGSNPSGLAAGTYSLVVTDGNGCIITQSATITSNTVAPGGSAGLDDTLNCGVAASLNLSGSSPTAGVSYSWTGPNSFASTQQNPTITSAGSYTVVITNTVNGCTSTDVVNIGQSSINASFTASPSSGMYPLGVGFTNTSTNATGYTWSFGNGGSSTQVNDSSTYLAPGTYTVVLIASNSFGCLDTATATIIVTEPSSVLIPNVFTPNGDGSNDIFFITSMGLTSLRCDIFDRWGLKMHEITSLTGGWDGKAAGGGDAADGTYFYILNAVGVDGKDIHREGYMLLAR